MHNKRVLSGVLVIPVLYFIVWVLPPVYFFALVVIASVVGQYEFYKMARSHGVRPLTVLGSALGSLTVLEFYHPLLPGTGKFFFVTACMLVIMIARLFSSRPVDGALDDIASTFLGVFYVALLFGFQVALRMGAHGKQWLVFLYLVIWASDTGAYYLGTAFGRHRLYEKISPKKSVEGLAGGMVASAIVALLCSILFLPSTEWKEAAALGLLLAAVGTAGDLTESLFKRAAGVKDSGTIIPGHGGMLDRMDSMLFAAPVLYYYLAIR